MLTLLKLFVFTASAIMAFIMFNLGMDYINFYSGLHPYIAFPVAIICVIICLYIFYQEEIRRFIDNGEWDDTDHYQM